MTNIITRNRMEIRGYDPTGRSNAILKIHFSFQLPIGVRISPPEGFRYLVPGIDEYIGGFIVLYHCGIKTVLYFFMEFGKMPASVLSYTPNASCFSRRTLGLGPINYRKL